MFKMSEKRNTVLPGEFLGERNSRKTGPGVYTEGEKVFSQFLGIPRISDMEMSVMPMSGRYIPRIGDRVVGIISSVEVSGWMVNISSPYIAFLPVSEAVDEYVDTTRTDISRYFDIGEVVFCKVSKVTKGKVVQVSLRDMLARKLYRGALVRVNPTKIPRIIGKAGSMINMIKQKTKCDIYTGQNGLVWVRGDDKTRAIDAILAIEHESQSGGLTEKIEKMLGDESVKEV
jgi:exosome complex component RRP4